ncbi:helix-turn-helix domain-containing protein, partial [Vagococcus silagei]
AYDRITTTLAIICHDLGTKVYPQKIVTIPCLMTINDIARASGTTRETASSVIKNLVKDKKINYNRKKLTFLNTKFFADILAD